MRAMGYAPTNAEVNTIKLQIHAIEISKQNKNEKYIGIKFELICGLCLHSC